jgi:hypothetical protein
MSGTKLSIGEIRVRAKFNPSNNPNVQAIKEWAADQIDELQAMYLDEVEIGVANNHEKAMIVGERNRLIAIAQTSIERMASDCTKLYTFKSPI